MAKRLEIPGGLLFIREKDEVAEILEQWRERSEKNKKDFAEWIGTSSQNYQHIISATNYPNFEILSVLNFRGFEVSKLFHLNSEEISKLSIKT